MDLTLTRGNHFQFGYNSRPFTSRTSGADTLFVRYGSCERPVRDFRSECVNAAREIHRSFKAPLYLCLSGGIDSEVMVEAFVESKVPFTIMIMRLNDNLNSHELFWAHEVCRKHSLIAKYFDLHVQQFFTSAEYEYYLEETSTVYPMLTTQMKIIEHICLDLKGIPVLGSGEVFLQKKQMDWYQTDSEPILSLYQFMIKRGYSGVPAYFQWNPEMVYSYMMDPLVKRLVSNEFPTETSSTALKTQIYNNYFSLKPRDKYYGFEQFSDYMTELLKKAHERFPHSNQASLIKYQDLVKILSPR